MSLFPQSKYHRRIIFFVSSLLIMGLIFAARKESTSVSYLWHTMTGQQKPVCKNCNVIVISLDTLSALHMPCYGYAKDTSPQLCTFAKNHIWFPVSFSQSFFTLPSHFSLFTSLYPSTHGMIRINEGLLNPNNKTLAEVLQRQGYQTLYFGPKNSNEFPLDRGLGRGFDYVHPSYAYNQEDQTLKNWRQGIAMLEQNQHQGKPTFLFLHTYNLHDPYLPGTRSLHFTKDNEPDIPVNQDEFFAADDGFMRFAKEYFTKNPVDVSAKPLGYTTYNQFMASRALTTEISLYNTMTRQNCPLFCLGIYYHYLKNQSDPKKVAFMEALYDESIRILDDQLADILSSITPLLNSNTILIITADHGEAFMEHGSLFHTSLYSEITRVPLIVSIPRVPKRTVARPAEGIDIYPTILNLLGISPPNRIDGTDLTAAILGVPLALGKPYIISERFPPDNRPISSQKSISSARWKLYVKDESDPENPKNIELYDVINDPHDTHNVAALYPSIAQGLLKKLMAFSDSHPLVETAVQSPESESSKAAPQEQRYFHY